MVWCVYDWFLYDFKIETVTLFHTIFFHIVIPNLFLHCYKPNSVGILTAVLRFHNRDPVDSVTGLFYMYNKYKVIHLQSY